MNRFCIDRIAGCLVGSGHSMSGRVLKNENSISLLFRSAHGPLKSGEKRSHEENRHFNLFNSICDLGMPDGKRNSDQQKPQLSLENFFAF